MFFVEYLITVIKSCCLKCTWRTAPLHFTGWRRPIVKKTAEVARNAQKQKQMARVYAYSCPL